MANQVKSVVESMNFHIRRLSKTRHYLDMENCPDYVCTMLPLYTPTRNLRSSNDPCCIDVSTIKITMATGVLVCMEAISGISFHWTLGPVHHSKVSSNYSELFFSDKPSYGL